MKITTLTILMSILICVAGRGQVPAFGSISLSDIQSASLSSAGINGNNDASNQMKTGTMIVYKTRNGKYGKLVIAEYGYNLRIKWRTYNSNGTLASQGDNLLIRGTYSCDLEAGRETTRQTGDFFWQQATSVIRSLTPVNGATFKLYSVSNEDSDNQFAGYVSDEEDRFVDYVWGFVDEFDNTWSNTQYYWGECRFLGADHLSFADAVDLTYIAGHGSASYIVMSAGQGCSLTSRAWGSYSSADRRGDLEYIVFHSCKVLSMDSGWRDRWRNTYSTRNSSRPFAGLHIAMGFKTNHYNGMGAGWRAADEFAENLEDGYSVRYAWYEAVEDYRWRAGYKGNKPAIFYLRPHKNETKSGHNSLDYKYGDPEYLLDAYYMD